MPRPPIPIPIPCDVRRQLDALRYFNLKVDHLHRSGFAARYSEELPHAVAKFENVSIADMGGGQFSIAGNVDSWLQDFNQDEIDAFVLTFRMFTQRNDPISIAKLAEIFESEWMPPQARQCFEKVGAAIKDHLSTAATIRFGNDTITIGTLVDVIIYGGMAHTNLEKTAVFESWARSGMMGFIWAEFFAYARFMLHHLQRVQHLNSQLLDAIDDGSAYFFVDEPE